MAKKKSTNWHVFGRRVLLRAVKKNDSGIIIATSVAENARAMYTYYVEEVGEDVPPRLKVGSEVYISLPGLVSIEGTTDVKADETFFFIDYNFIYLFKEPNKTQN